MKTDRKPCTRRSCKVSLINPVHGTLISLSRISGWRLAFISLLWLALLPTQASMLLMPDGGRLDAVDADGESIGPVPLKHTDVEVRISGHFTRVIVTQNYHNPYEQKIEAVYTFPLSHHAAVDRMTMTIGDRVVQGEVKERSAARRIYDAARAQGYVASLLDQERPNIFTQSLANIEPGAEISIQIAYVEVLESIDGEYRFSFPMVVAPRYTPGRPLATEAMDKAPDRRLPDPGEPFAEPTDQVPDANRVTPMPVRPDQRAGHDIALRLSIDSGGPRISEIHSPSHRIEQTNYDDRSRVALALAEADSIPNRDFLLTWRLERDTIEEAFLSHTGTYGEMAGGFFSLILQPPERVIEEELRPRELIFVLDNSGSMRGARAGGLSAIAAAKKVINLAIDTMRSDDRFNVISFNNTLDTLWDHSMPNSPKNREHAQRYVDARQGGGGTEMQNAVLRALGAGPFSVARHAERDEDVDRMRIVLFVTDGLVSNDDAIIAAIRKHAHETRVFTIGMSRAPNRHLLDEMARAGRGAADYVLPDDDVEPIVQRFANRIANPVLTDIDLEFGEGLEAVDVFPSREQRPDLFDMAPLVIHGRYTRPGRGTLTLRGRTGAGNYERVIDVTFPELEPHHDMIATLWARTKVGELMREGGEEVDAIIRLGEIFQLVTQHTSFVAVERRRVTVGGAPVLIRVPIEFPKDMSWEGIFGQSMPENMPDNEIIGHLRGRTTPRREPVRIRNLYAGRTAPQSPALAAHAPSAPEPAPSTSHLRLSRPRSGQPRAADALEFEADIMETASSVIHHDIYERRHAYSGRHSQTRDQFTTMGQHGDIQCLALRSPRENAEGVLRRLRDLLHDGKEPAEALVRVVVDETQGMVYLMIPESIVNVFEDYAAKLEPGQNLTGEQQVAAYTEMLADLGTRLPELRRTVELSRRLERSLRQRLDDYRNDQTMGKPAATLTVSVLLSDVSAETFASLEQAGLQHEATLESASLVVGRININRLETLALTDGVRRIEYAL